MTFDWIEGKNDACCCVQAVVQVSSVRELGREATRQPAIQKGKKFPAKGSTCKEVNSSRGWQVVGKRQVCVVVGRTGV